MVCHGLDGQNIGVPFAKTMSPPIPSLAGPEVQTYTDGQLKWIIENGIYPSGMQPSKGEFPTTTSGAWLFISAIYREKAAWESRRCTGEITNNDIQISISNMQLLLRRDRQDPCV